MTFERRIFRIVRRDHAPDCTSLPAKHSIRFARRSECRVIKNRQRGQTLIMFNLLKKNDLPQIYCMFVGVLQPPRKISDRDCQRGVINTNTRCI